MKTDIRSATHLSRARIKHVRPMAAAAFLCAFGATASRAQVTEQVLYNFTGGSDGAYPNTALLADTKDQAGSPLRALFGTASSGGNANCAGGGCGTAYKLTPPKGGGAGWKEATLWGFSGGSDGGIPEGGLSTRTNRVSTKTTIFGTTSSGGLGYGTVFSLTGTTLTTLYAFTGGADGANPYSSVIVDKNGVLYAATEYGGGASGCGTIIKLTPPAPGQTAWTETTIWSFTNGADGCGPNGLIIEKTGALYGTTEDGGTFDGNCTFEGQDYGCGTAFKLSPPLSGQTVWTEQTLWSFQGGNDGAESFAPLTAGPGSVLYGTTLLGGSSNAGTAFKLTPPKKGGDGWTEQIIWSFSDTDGYLPVAGLLLDANGALYGSTESGLAFCGEVFKLVPPIKGQMGWSEQVLQSFMCNDANGSFPEAPLIADKNGILYGTTVEGGTENQGVVFSLAGTGFVPK